jgi:hypothetical protein
VLAHEFPSIRARVDDLGGLRGIDEMTRIETSGGGQVAQQRRAFEIQLLHPREIQRRLGLPAENEVDERPRSARRLGDGRRKPPLISHRRRRYRAQGLAAGAAGAVTGPNLQKVGKAQKRLGRFIEPRGRGFAVANDAGCGFEKIRPSEIANEHEITGHDADRLGCSRAAVGDDE